MADDETPSEWLEDALTIGPLASARIEDEFKRNDVKYAVCNDGTITANWDHNQFFFFIAGEQNEILTVRGDWHNRLDLGQRSRLLELLDEWHRDTRWPKGFSHVDDAGHLWVSSELSVDWEHGLTNGQLHQTVICAVSTSLSLFEFLDERLKQAE
jgi:hypothetical protein